MSDKNTETIEKKLKRLADESKRDDLSFEFAHAFGADPAFEHYREGYKYCIEKGLFVPNEDLTPFRSDKTGWDDDYFASLQEDLEKNFSRERLEHMMKVAQELFKDKIDRMKAESTGAAVQKAQPPVQNQAERIVGGVGMTREEREQLQRNIHANESTRPAPQPPVHPVRPQNQEPSRESKEDLEPKKAPGGLLLLILAAVVIVLLLTVLLGKGSKALEEVPKETMESTIQTTVEEG